MNTLSLLLILHAHQPLGNFDSVIEENYRKSYLPFLDCFERHPGVAATLHYSGVLLEWLERHHPEYLDRLRRLREARRIEFLGGGFYEPVLISLPEPDRQAQLEQMQEYLENRFGERPCGIWLTERVWEPALPETLAAAGIAYTVLDDTHFLSAGLDPEQLYGHYETESLGRWVQVIPGLQSLRYFLPWKPVPEALALLAGIAEKHPQGLAAMGDDLEKFGGWPQTYHTVYEEGWLDNFFSAVEANRSWLQCPLASDYLNSHEAQGRVYIPTVSYREMTAWTLPPAAAQTYEEALARIPSLEGGDAFLRLLNAGCWRNFFAKYSESDLLHKQMLALSRRFQDIRSSAPAEAWQTAYRDLLRSQCNDAYWHGVFGGLYSPHLRHALHSHLIRAETALEHIERKLPNRRSQEIKWDGFSPQGEMLEMRSERVNCLVQASDGGTVPAIHYKPAAVNLVNSLRRRPEAYHRKIRAAATAPGGSLQSIHERIEVKEEGLDKFLLYDPYDCCAFRIYLFPENKTLADFTTLHLEEAAEWSAGRYTRETSDGSSCRLTRAGSLRMEGASLDLSVQKEFQLVREPYCDHLRCKLTIENLAQRGRFRLGLELVLNLLAGHVPDRHYSADGWQETLDWEGELTVPGPLTLRDEWLQISADLSPHPAPARWWLAPIFTVSQSEGGFERVYQGSRIMPVWDLNFAATDSWNGILDLTLRSLSENSSP